MTDRNEMPQVRALVRQLGGPAAVAKVLNVTLPAICNWSRRNAVPARHHAAIWRLAQQNGLSWTPPGMDGLVQPPRRRPPQDRAA